MWTVLPLRSEFILLKLTGSSVSSTKIPLRCDGSISLTFHFLLRRFLADIEESEAQFSLKGHTLLTGGEAALHVGADQDPKKMSIENILNQMD